MGSIKGNELTELVLPVVQVKGGSSVDVDDLELSAGLKRHRGDLSKVLETQMRTGFLPFPSLKQGALYTSGRSIQI